MFSVPNVPGSSGGGGGDSVDEEIVENGEEVDTAQNNGSHAAGEATIYVEEAEDEEEIVLREKPAQAQTPDGDYTNGDSPSDLTESNSLEEDLQKAISTAERRKVSQ